MVVRNRCKIHCNIKAGLFVEISSWVHCTIFNNDISINIIVLEDVDNTDRVNIIEGTNHHVYSKLLR